MDNTVKANCIECGAEYDIKRERLGRARCDVECDDGNECGGRLMEWKDPDQKRNLTAEEIASAVCGGGVE